MAYVKHWADNPKLNKTELKKLKKDGLEILKDIDYYAENGFESIPQEDWDLFKWAGLYLQRPKEAGYFMMRIKVHSGILNYEQTMTLASICKEYGRGIFDITTRQAIQFHWLKIEQMPDIFKRLKAVSLTTSGACGDITRNIVGNPLAGIDPHELMDTEPIVREVHEYFHENVAFSNLPRKYKMSISANVNNAAHAEINCVSFTPATKEIDGKKVIGFHVLVGGGLSARPYLAKKLNIFVKPEKVKDVAIAITTIFRDYGYREKRHIARLKFLMADWGPEKFTEKLLEYTGPLPESGEDEIKEWNAGYFYGVHPQKQKGLNYLGVNVPVGRLQADEVFEIARISKKYGTGDVRTCNSQNLIIPNIRDDKVETLLKENIFERLTIHPQKFIAYSVSCTGIEFCNLALVETKERMRRVAEYLDKHVSVDVPIRMHMIGCPNSCGQRQIADIGIQGIKMRTKDRKMLDAFEIYVGGTLDHGGKFNEKLQGKIEQQYLEPVLKELIEYFKETKIAGESFFTYYKRVGIEVLQQRFTKIMEQVCVPAS
ncbi:nitrite/sulfite reductase [Bacillus chungangensis]|uniref:Ferredoxin-nitrite reductase n=1 Tax=Bacillus chungangensis TaxID=587633 RepID=A0ABT9WTF9_9BACI|nr:nitrite/sulfite reductase [Bacillus chungangensis]MDQ0176525.1 ferredoxin-nitrite reductase [Bacillus chungangensis]